MYNTISIVLSIVGIHLLSNYNCDGEGSWIRVAQLNMSEPGATCPPGLTLQNYNNIDHSLCGQSSSGCASTFFSTEDTSLVQ